MAKKIEWMEELVQKLEKTQLAKTASLQTKGNIIVDPKRLPNCQKGDVISYKGNRYRVVNAAYSDAKGPGVLAALFDDEPMETAPLYGEEADDQSGRDAAPAAAAAQANGVKGQQFARRDPGDVYHYEIRDHVEQPSFEQAAGATMNDIHNDWQIDRGTADGYYAKPPFTAQETNVDPGQGPNVPVAANSSVMGYGYQNMGPSTDPTAAIADMAQEDQRIGFDVGEDWVDPLGHGTGDATPPVNEPHEIPDDYPGAEGTEVPGFVQQVNQVGGPSSATPPVQNAPALRLDNDQPGAVRSRLSPAAPAPGSNPFDVKSEPVTRDIEEGKAQDENADIDADDMMVAAGLKGNRIALRLAKTL